MTKHEQEILSHILGGGAITIPAFDEPITLDYIGASLDDEQCINLDELGQCEIYHTEDQLTIIKLKEQLADMTDQLKTIKTQKSKLGANLREANESANLEPGRSPYRKHLLLEEVREVEQILKKDWTTPNKTIMTAYGLSQSVMWNVRNGTHPKNTASYKQHLQSIKQGVGKLKD